jgi:hypothetical protein
MTESELHIYLMEVEEKNNLLQNQVEDLKDLIYNLCNQRVTKAQKDEIKQVLGKDAYIYGLKPSIKNLSKLSVDTVTGLHKEMYRQAEIYYATLKKGVDPGNAQVYFDTLMRLLSEDIGYRSYLASEEGQRDLKTLILMLDIERITTKGLVSKT